MRTDLAARQERYATLRRLIDGGHPITSVYFRAASAVEGGGDRDVRWQRMAAELAALGAPEPDVDAIAMRVAQLPPGDRVLAAFAAAGELRLDVELTQFATRDAATYGVWPRVVPLLRWDQRRVPAVVAIVRHGSAEITSYDADGRVTHVESVVGPDDEIEQNAPGGWSQPRYQRRALDSWLHNAAEFAARIARAGDEVQARALVLAGDVREVHLVFPRLPAWLRAVAVTNARVRPGRDGVARVPADMVTELVREAASRDRAVKLAEFDEAVGRRMAVEGPADVTRALDAGAVRRLVVVDRGDCSTLADVMVVAALDAGTEVVVAEPDDVTLVGDVGAILRY